MFNLFKRKVQPMDESPKPIEGIELTHGSKEPFNYCPTGLILKEGVEFLVVDAAEEEMIGRKYKIGFAQYFQKDTKAGRYADTGIFTLRSEIEADRTLQFTFEDIWGLKDRDFSGSLRFCLAEEAEKYADFIEVNRKVELKFQILKQEFDEKYIIQVSSEYQQNLEWVTIEDEDGDDALVLNCKDHCAVIIDYIKNFNRRKRIDFMQYPTWTHNWHPIV